LVRGGGQDSLTIVAIDDQDEDEETGPQRRCIATGVSGPVEAMIRFVVGPDDLLVPDIEARLPGRGMWLSARRDVVNSAVKKALFAKAARRKVLVPADLAECIEGMLRRRCLDLIGLARRAGQVVSGYDQVRSALKSGKGALLLSARDGAPDGIDKLRALAPALPVAAMLSAAELGQAFGRDHTVHGLLMPGKLASRLRLEAGRLAGMTAQTEDDKSAASGPSPRPDQENESIDDRVE
jgi:predicted RNA-binding protein YlxR (DUF448 family)/ribosomal protein L30E